MEPFYSFDTMKYLLENRVVSVFYAQKGNLLVIAKFDEKKKEVEYFPSKSEKFLRKGIWYILVD